MKKTPRSRKGRGPAGPPCRACNRAKPTRWYVCGNCWALLSDSVRRALDRRDQRTVTRLYAHIDCGRPLSEMEAS